ncbi:chemotaxis response regulator protein-glutamate methylesterase [Pseudalkalibacillus sp. SCS-8]|uniref:protein-glutamate methylesterase/protein-glutamine glutaminase n=1 Tax=Pseudalkalibacillus nanhaiensis TaxID=3115291 RepID=UPI0032DBB2DB
MNKIKVLVVDDSAFMRKILTDLLQDDRSIEVVGTARNGQDALEKIPRFNPDVITLDVEMPVMDGLETLKEIIRLHGLPVIMVSSVTQSGAKQTIEAMQQGAIDFIPKPSGSISLDIHKVQNDLIEKVKTVSGITVKDSSPSITAIEDPVTINQRERASRNEEGDGKKLIAIGTSTGGPKALVDVIANLPKGIASPVLIVQHMPVGFTRSLAERLNKLSELHVKEAEENEEIVNGTVYIAPGGYHLKVRENGDRIYVELDEHTPPTKGHRPSVDEMFMSIAKLKGYQKIAVIMTGMGADGSKGLLSLKEDGRTIAIAESEETCVVFGMPKAAIQTNQVDEIVRVDEISHRIVHHLNVGG